jgi:hypothetical protein
VTQRQRKFVGVLLMLASVAAVAGIGTWIYLALLQGQAPILLVAFFAVAGLAWIVPAMWIIRWMVRPDA